MQDPRWLPEAGVLSIAKEVVLFALSRGAAHQVRQGLVLHSWRQRDRASLAIQVGLRIDQVPRRPTDLVAP